MTTKLKDRVRCWFDCLRLAHQSTNPEVIKHLQNSYYSEWGDYQSMAFTPWWKAHKHLFQDAPKSRRLKPGDQISENEFVIAIPFVQTPTSVGRMVKEMYEREFVSHSSTRGKQKRRFDGSYELTGELRISRMRFYLLYLSEIYLPLVEGNSQVPTYKLINRAEDVFERQSKKIAKAREQKKITAATRKKTKRVALPKEDSKIPFISNDDSNESRSRMVRNYNNYCRNLLLNVSRGEFPGKF
jgi:hypothetical protein